MQIVSVGGGIDPVLVVAVVDRKRAVESGDSSLFAAAAAEVSRMNVVRYPEQPGPDFTAAGVEAGALLEGDAEHFASQIVSIAVRTSSSEVAVDGNEVPFEDRSEQLRLAQGSFNDVGVGQGHIQYLPETNIVVPTFVR